MNIEKTAVYQNGEITYIEKELITIEKTLKSLPYDLFTELFQELNEKGTKKDLGIILNRAMCYHIAHNELRGL